MRYGTVDYLGYYLSVTLCTTERCYGVYKVVHRTPYTRNSLTCRAAHFDIVRLNFILLVQRLKPFLINLPLLRLIVRLFVLG